MKCSCPSKENCYFACPYGFTVQRQSLTAWLLVKSQVAHSLRRAYLISDIWRCTRRHSGTSELSTFAVYGDRSIAICELSRDFRPTLTYSVHRAVHGIFALSYRDTWKISETSLSKAWTVPHFALVIRHLRVLHLIPITATEILEIYWTVSCLWDGQVLIPQHMPNKRPHTCTRLTKSVWICQGSRPSR